MCQVVSLEPRCKQYYGSICSGRLAMISNPCYDLQRRTYQEFDVAIVKIYVLYSLKDQYATLQHFHHFQRIFLNVDNYVWVDSQWVNNPCDFQRVRFTVTWLVRSSVCPSESPSIRQSATSVRPSVRRSVGQIIRLSSLDKSQLTVTAKRKKKWKWYANKK